MSGPNSSARMPKSSPNLVKQGPLKATIPISSVMKPNSNFKSSSGNNVSPTYYWKNKSPDQSSGQRSPGSAGYKGKPKSSLRDDPGGPIRRTASMDAIYLQGHWPRDGFHWNMGMLHVNEATQTDESGPSDLRQRQRVSESDDRSERPSARSTVWNTKDVAVRHGSPSGEQNLNSSSSQTISTFNSPTLLKPLNRPSIRSSVEGLNQEIERLVLKTESDAQSGSSRCFDIDRYSEAIPEGHRAPVADLFKYAGRSRSVDTQTPQNFGSSSNSSSDSQGSSPDHEASKLGSSPQINRFLAREPPDGCEKVQSKSVIDKKMVPLDHVPQPSRFKLKPSLGSAFKILKPVKNNNSDQDLPKVPSDSDDDDD